MQDYAHKYRKYKSKYNELKLANSNNNSLVGGDAVGNYETDGHNFVSALTHSNRHYSYYEVNPLLVSTDDFTKRVKPNNSKVLCVDNLVTFDIFTNMYAVVYTDPEREQYIRVNWDKVSADFKGFYLDNNTLLRLQRHEYAIFKNKRVISWMRLEKIPLNVMMFK